jgi:hypothetical protein
MRTAGASPPHRRQPGRVAIAMNGFAGEGAGVNALLGAAR